MTLKRMVFGQVEFFIGIQKKEKNPQVSSSPLQKKTKMQIYFHIIQFCRITKWESCVFFVSLILGDQHPTLGPLEITYPFDKAYFTSQRLTSVTPRLIMWNTGTITA